MALGRLRVYLGVAPGVGTTHALLDEASRRAARGRHIVAGLLDASGRAPVPRGIDPVTAPGTWDLALVLARRPDVVIVDDLAAELPDATGRRRWQAAADLIAAGVDVLAATDVTAVASMQDEVTRLTGHSRDRCIPDSFLLGADQLELIDMAPEALRRRLAHGGIVQPDDMDAALARQFSVPVLTRLRELALGFVLRSIRSRAPDAETVGPLLVAVSGGSASETLLRRALRLADEDPGTPVVAIEVVGSERLPRHSHAESSRLRELASEWGIGYRQVVGAHIADALLDVAAAERARGIVVGTRASAAEPARHTWPTAVARRAIGGWSVAETLVRAGAGSGLEIVLVPQPPDPAAGPLADPAVFPALRPKRTAVRRASGLGRVRRWIGAAMGVILPIGVTLLGQAGPAWIGLPGVTMAFLLAVILTSLVGGLLPALVGALTASTLLNYFFIPPLHSLVIGEPHNMLALGMFVLVGSLVSMVVNRASVESARAAQASAESRTLAVLADSALHGAEALPRMLEQARASFGMTSASLLTRRNTDGAWLTLHTVGPEAPTEPDLADVWVPAGPGLVLAMSGRALAASDQVVLRAFAAQAQNLLERDALARSAALAAKLEATEKLRDSLLGAVGHDLRKPLASARAAIESLRTTGIAWSPDERAELLDTAYESLDRLTRIVDDLLEASRLQTGALRVARDEVWLDEIIPPALDELGVPGESVRLRVPDDLPAAVADAALVKRIVSNLVGNALDHGSSVVPPTVSVSAAGDAVQVRVVDRGAGLSVADRERAFLPFQRLGDSGERTGLGLGLALARGLAEAMGGTVEAEDTPGGGLTMVLTLPAASPTSRPSFLKGWV